MEELTLSASTTLNMNPSAFVDDLHRSVRLEFCNMLIEVSQKSYLRPGSHRDCFSFSLCEQVHIHCAGTFDVLDRYSLRHSATACYFEAQLLHCRSRCRPHFATAQQPRLHPLLAAVGVMMRHLH